MTYNYRYSIGVDRVVFVHVLKRFNAFKTHDWWKPGTIYEYGYQEPRYPVPSTIGELNHQLKFIAVQKPNGGLKAYWSKE